MKIHNYPGFLIDIEGLDGSGASTQVKLLAARFKELGIKHFVTKEPTDSQIGKLIHEILQKNHRQLSPTTLRLLFATDGSIHLDEVITPELKKGQMVITDRYAWSSVAYGSVYLDKQWLLELNREFILPDLTIFLEVAPEICLRRLGKEKKSVELFDQEEDLMRTWDTYHWLASKYWWAQITVVDGEKTREEVAEDIWARLKFHSRFQEILKKK